MPEISVIIPIYKVEKYLAKCVDSVINQTFDNIEIILVDDESPDNCPEMCDKYAAVDSRIRVIHQKNRGLGGARNAGIDIARGKYIFVLDSDDWIDTDGLRILHERAEQNNADIVLTGETLYMENSGKFCAGWRDFSNIDGTEKLGANNFYKTFSPAWGRLYRADFLNRNNLRFVEKCWFEDNSWGCLVFALANSVAFAPNVVFYRQRDDSVTGAMDLRVLDFVRDFEFFMNFVHKNNLLNNPKVECAYIWYLKSFHDYLFKLNECDRPLFYNRIKEVAHNLRADVGLMKKMGMSPDSRAVLCSFYNTIKYQEYEKYKQHRRLTLFGLPLLTIDTE